MRQHDVGDGPTKRGGGGGDLLRVKREYALSSFSAVISCAGLPSLRIICSSRPWLASSRRLAGHEGGRGRWKRRETVRRTDADVVQLHGGGSVDGGADSMRLTVAAELVFRRL